MLAAGNGNLTYSMYSSTNSSSWAMASDPCCICYNPFSTTTTVESESPVQIACGHIFGEKCLARWLNASSTCPICRRRPQGCKTSETHDSCNDDLEWHDPEDYGWLEADSNPQAETEATNAGEDTVEEPPYVTSQDMLWNLDSATWPTWECNATPLCTRNIVTVNH